MGASLQPLMAQAVGAKTLAGVAAARAQLAKLLELNYKTLNALVPPPALADLHPAVERVMLSYKDLQEPFVPSKAKNSCGLPESADLQVYDAKIALYYGIKSASYDLTVQDLAKAKLTFGKNVMPAPPDRPVRNHQEVNGKVIQRAGAAGSGRLQITNDDVYYDAVVVVSTTGPKTPQASIYVRSGSKATLSGIRGTYRVYIKTGTDWDAAHRGFTDGCSYKSFLDSFDSRSVWKIGLGENKDGNALTSEVPAF